jgi:hypothetical protein
MADRFDPEAMLATLLEEGVSFLVVGGVAAGLYGSERPTFDLDVLPEPGIDNARKLARALERLDARFRGIEPGEHDIGLDAETLAGGANFMLATRHGDLDVMPILEGGRPWPELEPRAVSVPLASGDAYRLIGRDDLIAMKRAAGRRKDIEDIVQMTAGQYLARNARATVHLTGILRAGVPERDALEAADIATLSYEDDVTLSVTDEGAVRRLHVDCELPGFTRAHAEAWASIVKGKIGAAGVLDGEMESAIQASAG